MFFSGESCIQLSALLGVLLPTCSCSWAAISEVSTQMFTGIWKISILLLIFLFIEVSGSFIGINIGTDISTLPSASNIVSILQGHKIKHVRLFDADRQILTALANTGIEVMVGVPNDQLLRVGESRAAAADWVNRNVAAYLPGTNITYIAVGNEVLTSIPNAALVLVPAMQFLQSALLAANLNFQVKISSPQSMDMISKSFPPSTATFNSTWSAIMYNFLQFLKNTGSSFMLNAQPYYGYSRGNGIFPLEYALFRSLNPDNQIMDPNTLSTYSNMFDAMVDSAYYSMQELNFSGIPIIVTATGWPSSGGDNEPHANIDNALAYNTNLVRHILNNSGTPSQPKSPINAYIHELFNEDLIPGSLSEKNWGLFFPNGTTVYELNFEDVGGGGSASSPMAGIFCVANNSADTRDLKQGLDWACGPGGANCSAIQSGKPCYEDDNIVAVASYAFNDYYHRTQASGGTCSFGHTAMITTNDPSHGSCIFAGSMGLNSSTTRGTGFGPVSPINGIAKRQALRLCHHLALLMLLFLLFTI